MENHSSVTGWQELFLVELALAELDSKNAGVFFPSVFPRL